MIDDLGLMFDFLNSDDVTVNTGHNSAMAMTYCWRDSQQAYDRFGFNKLLEAQNVDLNCKLTQDLQKCLLNTVYF